ASQHRLRLECEFDRAWTVDEGQALAHEAGRGHACLDAHLVRPGLGRMVSDRIAGGNRVLLGNGAGAREYGFEQRRLATGEWPDERNAFRSLASFSCAISHDCVLLLARHGRSRPVLLQVESLCDGSA